MLRSSASRVPAASTWIEWSTTMSTGTSGSILFGSRPSFCAAERIAARSANSGTPVKSCRITRATVKGISSVRSALGFQPASCLTCSGVTLTPSQFLSTDSSTMRIETGSRDTDVPSAASSFFSEAKRWLPLAVEKESWVLKVSVMMEVNLVGTGKTAESADFTGSASPAGGLALQADAERAEQLDRAEIGERGGGAGNREARPEPPAEAQQNGQQHEQQQRGQHQPEDAAGKRGDLLHVAGVEIQPDKGQQRGERQRGQGGCPEGAALGHFGHRDKD